MVDYIINDIEIWKLECKNEKWAISTDYNNKSVYCAGINDEHSDYFGKELIDIKIVESKNIIEISTKLRQNTNTIFEKLKNEYNNKKFILKTC
jgi:hypothetical protein